MAKPTHHSKACQCIFNGLQLLCSLLVILVFITFITFAGFITTTYKPTRLTNLRRPETQLLHRGPVSTATMFSTTTLFCTPNGLFIGQAPGYPIHNGCPPGSRMELVDGLGCRIYRYGV
ncbi:hypothetical protein M0R45_004711 [Rubus argutus]|uniref:Uncharacterized protein n=1 Tax=Rubus argutus TaxID=59490 RepID=A0AAW1YKY8_RUBAR